MQSSRTQYMHTHDSHKNHKPTFESPPYSNHIKVTNYEFKTIKTHTTRKPRKAHPTSILCYKPQLLNINSNNETKHNKFNT